MIKSVLLRILLLCVAAFLLMISGIAAGTIEENTTPLNKMAKIDTGPRPQGEIAFLKDGGIWIMDTDGKNRYSICQVTNAVGRISFSPDNKRIAFSREGQDASKLPSDEGGAHKLHDIFIAFVDSAKTNPSWWNRATFGLGGYYPEWSDNDSMVYYQNDINAGFVDYIIPSHQLAKVSVYDGHGEHYRKDYQSLATNMIMPTFTRDGEKVAYVISFSLATDKYNFQNFGVKIVNMADIMKPESEMRKATPGLEKAISPQWSPDGQWLAYLNNDMRNPGIYVIKADLSETRLIYSPTVTQGLNPFGVGWAPNSKWMTFAAGDGTIYIVDINGENLTAITGPGKHSNPTWSH